MKINAGEAYMIEESPELVNHGKAQQNLSAFPASCRLESCLVPNGIGGEIAIMRNQHTRFGGPMTIGHNDAQDAYRHRNKERIAIRRKKFSDEHPGLMAAKKRIRKRLKKQGVPLIELEKSEYMKECQAANKLYFLAGWGREHRLNRKCDQCATIMNSFALGKLCYQCSMKRVQQEAIL